MSIDITPHWRRWTVAACAAAAVAVPTAAHAAALPSGPTTDAPASAGELTVTDSSQPLGPGITLRHLRTLTPDQGWVDLREILVDLTKPNIVPDVVTGATIPTRTVLTSLAASTGATAIVNGDFFDINGTGASEGLELQNGDLLKGSVADHHYLTFADDGLARIEDLVFDASVSFGDPAVKHDVVTFNDP
jgi:hypothetical protein